MYKTRTQTTRTRARRFPVAECRKLGVKIRGATPRLGELNRTSTAVPERESSSPSSPRRHENRWIQRHTVIQIIVINRNFDRTDFSHMNTLSRHRLPELRTDGFLIRESVQRMSITTSETTVDLLFFWLFFSRPDFYVITGGYFSRPNIFIVERTCTGNKQNLTKTIQKLKMIIIIACNLIRTSSRNTLSIDRITPSVIGVSNRIHGSQPGLTVIDKKIRHCSIAKRPNDEWLHTSNILLKINN